MEVGTGYIVVRVGERRFEQRLPRRGTANQLSTPLNTRLNQPEVAVTQLGEGYVDTGTTRGAYGGWPSRPSASPGAAQAVVHAQLVSQVVQPVTQPAREKLPRLFREDGHQGTGRWCDIAVLVLTPRLRFQ